MGENQAETDNTERHAESGDGGVQIQRNSGKWAKGQSGNPAGKPLGARNKVATQFDEDLYCDWEVNGAEAIAKMRREDNSRYVELVERRIGRTLSHVSIDTTSPGGLQINLVTVPPEPKDITPLDYKSNAGSTKTLEMQDNED